MGINHWPETERPRERLIAAGAAALSDSELLAIFLRTGVRGASAVDLARQLLARFGTLASLFAAPLSAVAEISGLGPAKYAQLQAVLEMARRALREEMQRRDALTSPAAVRDYLRLALQGKEREVFVAVFLDAQHRAIGVEELFAGTLAQTSVYPREVVRRALAINAAAIIFAHNHPSGLAEPSHADQALTRALTQALALVDVRVLDHFVVARGSCVSFAERGLL
ncbi:MAG: RadC family protein [Pseudomonadota bacterium]